MRFNSGIWKFINPVYLLAVAGSVALYESLVDYRHASPDFYGFAENKETNINLDYPVEVVRIPVVPGQFVRKGDLLAEVVNAGIGQAIESENLGIKVLEAREDIWKEEEKADIRMLELEKQNKLTAIQQQIDQAQAELKYQSDLWDGLKSIAPVAGGYHPQEEKIKQLQLQYRQEAAAYDLEITNRKTYLDIHINPYRQERARIHSAINLEKKRSERFRITAPHDGLIGNVHCREGEFIDEFTTLISFYEANPTQVKAYVYENQLLHVALQDTFWVSSIRTGGLKYKGVLVGLGSRIVEIPERMRKIPEIKAYGREVTIEISPDNSLLQKEKVRLQQLTR